MAMNNTGLCNGTVELQQTDVNTAATSLADAPPARHAWLGKRCAIITCQKVFQQGGYFQWAAHHTGSQTQSYNGSGHPTQHSTGQQACTRLPCKISG